MRAIASVLVTAAFLGMAGRALAHGEGHARKPAAQPPVETAFGRTGDPGKAARTIRVDMADTMRFTPGAITVKRGETVRFVASNSGRTMHEMVIGTAQALREHAELMKKHPGMEHDETWMAHVAPGKSAGIVRQFTKNGDFLYGCLVPGHFEAGMIGKIAVR